MGSVIKQKSGKYAIRFDEPAGGTRKQKQIGGFIRKADAEKELKKIEGEIASGDFFRVAEITVSDFIATWLRDYVKPTLSTATYDFYDSLYRTHAKGYFETMPLSELKANQIDRFYAHLKTSTSLSTTSIHHCHKMLRTALNKAVKWDYIRVSPMTKVTAPKLEQREMKFWNEDEIKAGLKILKGTYIEWHATVAIFSGLREGEICALNEKNIDFNKKTFTVAETAQRVTGKGVIFKEPKTEKSKATLPLSPQLEKLFRERIHRNNLNRIALGKKYNRQHDGYLSVWHDGEIMDPKYIGKEFKRILTLQEEVPIIRFHDLRHSCAAWLIAQGVDLKTIQEILRHADFSTTANIYGHVTMDGKKDALAKLQMDV